MPVKIEYPNSRSSPMTAASSTSFDCSMLFNDLFDQPDFVGESNFSCFDDIWNSIIPTPPQSPQLKYGDNLSMDEKMSSECKVPLETILTHDCMWSGKCSEGLCQSLYRDKPTGTYFRPDTPFTNFSTSPQSTLNFISYDFNTNENYMEEESDISSTNAIQNNGTATGGEIQQCMDGNVYAMANDHSYGHSSTSAQQRISSNHSSSDSLILRNNSYCQNKTISQAKISKIKTSKRISNRKSANSILNTNANSNSSNCRNNSKTTTTTTNESSVLKPTIISVASFKNIQDNYHTKYKVSIKKKKLNIDNGTSTNKNQQSTVKSSSGRSVPVYEFKNISSNNNNILATINSPTCSDSEESSLSLSSLGDGHLNGCNGNNGSPPVKRREHNDSERKRRDHLRNSFNNLRDQIPKLKEAQKRPPRIMILHEATTYVQELIHQNEDLEDTLNKELERKAMLMEKLEKLSRNQ